MTIPARGTAGRYRLYFWLILCVGVLTRVVLFGLIPGGVNQDEAFAGYEAYSLLTYGVDSAGYAFPVYLTAWGSGMNALESYLMMPFIALLGLKVWVIRLPQLIVSLFSLWVLYLTVRRVRGEREALAAMLLLATCPWHVLLSRWGLESNLAPGFLLFGFYFFLRGLEDSRFFPLSALMYGLSLYAYATVWLYVPFVLLAQAIYCARHGRLRPDLHTCLAVLLLAALAAPLILFVLINYGALDEIKTSVFSIPRLVVARTDNVTLYDIPRKTRDLLRLLLTQTDGQPCSAPEYFGLLFPMTTAFAALGLAVSIRRLWGRRAFCTEALLLPQLVMALLLGLIIYVNANRINVLWMPVIIYAAIGMVWSFGLIRWYKPAVLAAYAAMFLLFEGYFFTDYRELLDLNFEAGLEQAVALAEASRGDVYFDDTIAYSQVLFYTKEPAPEFADTVVYKNYPAAFLAPSSFGRYHFGYDTMALDPDAVYVLDAYYLVNPDAWEALGFSMTRTGWFYTAVWTG